MPRVAAGLTAAKVRTAKPGRYGDGNGLYLFVKPNETRFWVFRYVLQGRMREMGLGRAGAEPGGVSLAEARGRAGELMRLVRGGSDPLAQREADEVAAKAASQEAAIRAITFRAVVEQYVAAHEAAWRNPKHRQQWRNTLAAYAFPVFGDMPVADVETGHVLAALEPVWREKPETAVRLRGQIKSVLDYARVREWRTGENPARWRGHLDKLLPARGRVAPVEHHAALPWREIAPFMSALRGQAGMAARALAVVILTAARTGEVLGATWGEMDVRGEVWTIPAARMKAGKEHRVPLSRPVLDILHEMAKLHARGTSNAYVFPGAKPGQKLSIMAMAMVLRRMVRPDLTVHGFRSSFRDWTSEATTCPREVAEAALAHTLGDKVEAAYRRGDLFEKRRVLMTDWAEFCARPCTVSDEPSRVGVAPMHLP